MDNKLIYAVLAVLAALCLGASAMSLPASDHRNDIQYQVDAPHNSLDEDERATWLETRDIEEEFKELVYVALEELVSEERIADIVSLADQSDSKMEKRGRWQGFCFRRTRSGRFLPYICWKGGDEAPPARK